MLHDKFNKMLSKKKDISDNEAKARGDVLNDLQGMASEEMGKKLQKVSVMSDSKEGLSKGLEKAKQIVSSPEMDGMVDHAENPYGDAESADEEHEGEEDHKESNVYSGREGNNYSEGGEVEGQEESPDKGEYEAVDQGSPSEDEESPAHEMSESPEEEDEEMSHDEIDQKIQELMALKQRMQR